MTSRIGKGAGLLAAVVGAGIFLAPGALAAPSPPVPPGPPPGYDGLPYHNMPGRIGHQPGAYTYILGFWMRPRRVLDAAGTGAMTNTDSASAEYGMPGSELGVEPLRNSTLGVAPGVRPESPMDSIGAPDPAGGVVPGPACPVRLPAVWKTRSRARINHHRKRTVSPSNRRPMGPSGPAR
ncbi:hypothetical protein I542_4730 [Mycobacteroides abscessus 1948]|uniref:Uncharacterized protein n=1 Tax=Mycobacteroides abscessus 1948 TaxID=1299323 RepID=A0A829QPH9_9MYCO|nr:hypothetical protein I542_4730 [Mycobacteroides abscessus 1948]